MEEGFAKLKQFLEKLEIDAIRTFKSDTFQTRMIWAIIGVVGFKYLGYICEVHIPNSVFKTIFDEVSKFLIFFVLMMELICHICISRKIDKVFSHGDLEEEQINEGENSDDEKTEFEKIKKILSKYIKSLPKVQECADLLIKFVDIQSDNEEEKEKSNLPLSRDQFLPWQGSVLEPQNPLSLATSISMESINNPMMPAYTPDGVPRRQYSEAKENAESHKITITPATESMNLRNSSQRDSKSNTLLTNVKFYENVEKIKTQDNFASWISYVLFEEAKKIEIVTEDDKIDELSLALKKKSTLINVSTSANQNKNFTNENKVFDPSKFIVYNHIEYDRRRVSSLVNKSSSPMPKEMIECMKQFKTWNFDAFLLNSLTQGNPLSFFMQYIYQAYMLNKKLDMDSTKYKAFMCEIQGLYHKENTYHNAIHGADVAQAVFYFLEKGDVNITCGLDLLETISCLIAGAVHDVDHPGVNNYYILNIKSPLAIVYNDKSILENCHAATAFNLMRDEKNGIVSDQL